jgi:hypothetical protein
MPYKNHLYINKKFKDVNYNYTENDEEENRRQIKEAVYSNKNKIFQNQNSKEINSNLTKSLSYPNSHAEINNRNKFIFESDKEKIYDLENNFQYHQIKNLNELPVNKSHLIEKDRKYDYNYNAKLNFTKEKKNIFMYGKILYHIYLFNFFP